LPGLGHLLQGGLIKGAGLLTVGGDKQLNLLRQGRRRR
jgi:hypothetical protein